LVTAVRACFHDLPDPSDHFRDVPHDLAVAFMDVEAHLRDQGIGDRKLRQRVAGNRAG